MLQTFLKSVGNSLRGLRVVFIEEPNFRIQVAVSIAVFLVAWSLRFSPIEYFALVVAILFVLLIEILNTAIEDLCNKIEPLEDPLIGKIKDIAAGAVLLSSIGALVIGLIVFGNHLLR